MRAWILRLTIQAGDVEIDLEGAAIQIDEQMLQTKTEHTWTVLLERIREARERRRLKRPSALHETPVYPSVVQPSERCSKTVR